MVREYIEISEPKSIAALIQRLEQVRDTIPSGSGPEQVRLRGDDVFGRHILITYLRPESADEHAFAARVALASPKWASGSSRGIPAGRSDERSDSL